MSMHPVGRREFLMTMAAAGAAGLVRVEAAYDPAASFDVAVSEVEFRRNAGGRMLMARIYQPKGAGPFPTVLDLHGGAWNAKDRHAEEPMDRAIAASGVLVVAIDMTLAADAPYPACVQDANYGVRWLKTKAATWNGDPSRIGVYGSSSGGHVAELLAMRPRDPRYNAIALPGAAVDATIAYAAMRSPISNPVLRFENAQKLGRDAMVKNHTTFFKPSCRARSTTTCCRPSRRSSSPATAPPAAIVSTTSSRTASTSGSRSRDRRPIVRARW